MFRNDDLANLGSEMVLAKNNLNLQKQGLMLTTCKVEPVTDKDYQFF